MEQVRKRNGRIVEYDARKIANCIRQANENSKDARMSCKLIYQIVGKVEDMLEGIRIPSVERIQDCVEKVLLDTEYLHTAKAYIAYRSYHAKLRDNHNDMIQQILDITCTAGVDMDYKRSNANIQSDTSMGSMLLYGTTVANYINDNYIIPKLYVDAHREGYIHIHDKDFLSICWNCCQIDLEKLYKGGYSTGHGTLREPNSIRSAAALACIAIQSNQNEMFGGQSIAQFDRTMAIAVRKTYAKEYKKAVKNLLRAGGYKDIADKVVESITKEEMPTYLKPDNVVCLSKIIAKKFPAVAKDINSILENAYSIACDETKEETWQAMEAVIYNFNTLHSRSGAQVPFSSLNFGTDTTPEGRLVAEQLMLAQYKGMGKGETSIFPITIFRMRKGINVDPQDPNYDLWKLACKVSAKRLYPNFESQDAPYNFAAFDPNDYRTEVATMGCRTRVVENVNGPSIVTSRGNFSSTTINLPKLAIESDHDIKKFRKLLKKYMDLCKDQLIWRYNLISHRHAYNYPFLLGQGVWLDGEKLKPDDEIGEVLKHASIAIGFCGLAEALVALIGKHHGESEEARKLGYDIIKYMRETVDKYKQETHMNWSLFATPAESTAGRFARMNTKQYGVIKGVTDRDYITNSFHVPVYYQIKALDKIKIEAPYHALCNGGHISYIELDGDTTKNVKAFEKIVRAMYDNNMGYFAINHPVDRCSVCGNTGIIDGHVCPVCGHDEIIHDEHYKIPCCSDCGSDCGNDK